MKKIFFLSGCMIGLMTVFSSCSHNDNEETKADRTVLVYMSGENSLWDFVDNDLNELITGSSNIGNNNLLVYVDRGNSQELPWLARLKNGEVTDSVSISDMRISDKDEYASDPKVMEAVVRYAFEKYPSGKNDYALAFFGHGNGWLIRDSLSYTAMARKRAYGIDNGVNGKNDRPGKWLNIPTMAKMLSKLPHLTYIFFDCCNMQCLEVAYELRNVADYIIGSPSEIPAVGAPYNTVAPALFEPTMFYTSIVDKYRDQSSVPLSVIKTSEMSNLASATRTILQTIADSFRGEYPDMSGLIYYYYDWSTKQEFYDANDFFLKYSSTDNYNAWKKAFDNAVIYKKMATQWDTDKDPWDYYLYFVGDFEVTDERFGGMSMFIPQYRFQYSDNMLIKQLGWYYAAGYNEIGW